MAGQHAHCCWLPTFVSIKTWALAAFQRQQAIWYDLALFEFTDGSCHRMNSHVNIGVFVNTQIFDGPYSLIM